ncbi:ras guanine nucleotide exchange factor i-related [Anaeramoeba flamelloides]|uniref:Ras guanine nucleotide exchange factor i-related n=1 Tax=Anaeramoeba flamelloides TaxID=1746091 RepID=A0ABQ8YVS2_9EUKA|nr:ras guanine nucleotide exchange factor i-related [Anaeramoeba flamelloides]
MTTPIKNPFGSNQVINGFGLNLKSPVGGRGTFLRSSSSPIFKREQVFGSGRGRGRSRGRGRGRGINNNILLKPIFTPKVNNSQTKELKKEKVEKQNTQTQKNENNQQTNGGNQTQQQKNLEQIQRKKQRTEEKMKREQEEQKRLNKQKKRLEEKEERTNKLKKKLQLLKSKKQSRYGSYQKSTRFNRDLVAERMEQRSKKRQELSSQSSPNIFLNIAQREDGKLFKPKSEQSQIKIEKELQQSTKIPLKNDKGTDNIEKNKKIPNDNMKKIKYGRNASKKSTQTWKSFQIPEKEIPLVSKVDVNRTDWKSRILKRNPEINDLRERVIPISRCESFIRLYGPGKDEVREKLTNEIVLQLIMQNLITLGFRKTKKILEHEADVKYKPHYLKDSRLRKLIKNGMKDIEYVWEQTMSQQKNEEESGDGNLNLINHFNYMGLEEDDDEEEDLTSIWDHEENNIIVGETEHSKTNEVKAATLNKLVELLTHETNQNIKYMKTFLMTYQSFTTPAKLFSRLMQRYHVPITQGITEEEYKIKKQCIQLRVCNVLKTWLSENFSEFNRKLLDKVINFLDQTVSKSNKPIAETIKKKILRNIELGGQDFKNSRFMKDPPEPKVPKNIFSPDLSLFDIDEEEIARQLTLLEFNIYQKIRPPELLNLAWSKTKLKYRAPNVIALIHRFNEVSAWVVTTILKHERVRERARIIMSFCKIAEYLRSLNNYNGVMAIVSGFENSAIWRLKYTFEEVPKRNHEIIQELKKELSSDNSYRYYRSLLRKVDPPCIPYLGVYLTDLTFIEEGNPDFIDGLINFSKRRLIYDVIFEIQNFQNKCYNLQPIQQIVSFLEKLPILDEKECYSKSLKYEPRKAKREDILF